MGVKLAAPGFWWACPHGCIDRTAIHYDAYELPRQHYAGRNGQQGRHQQEFDDRSYPQFPQISDAAAIQRIGLANFQYWNNRRARRNVVFITRRRVRRNAAVNAHNSNPPAAAGNQNQLPQPLTLPQPVTLPQPAQVPPPPPPAAIAAIQSAPASAPPPTAGAAVRDMPSL